MSSYLQSIITKQKFLETLERTFYRSSELSCFLLLISFTAGKNDSRNFSRLEKQREKLNRQRRKKSGRQKKISWHKQLFVKRAFGAPIKFSPSLSFDAITSRRSLKETKRRLSHTFFTLERRIITLYMFLSRYWSCPTQEFSDRGTRGVTLPKKAMYTHRKKTIRKN